MPDQPTESTQSGSASGDSVELLQQILARLNQMEGGLSQHEEWLRRMEQEHRPQTPPAESAPQGPATAASSSTASSSEAIGQPAGEEDVRRLIGALTLERDRSNKNLAEAERKIGQYQQELVSIRPQLADLQKQAAERERQLKALKETSSTQIGQAQAVQTEARRQLQERQHQLQTLQDRVQSLEKQLKDKEQRIAELQQALTQAANRLETAAQSGTRSAAEGAEGNTGRWPRFARVCLVVIFGAAIISVSLTAYLYERLSAGANQLASCTIILPGADAPMLKQCTELASKHAGVIAMPDSKLGGVELTIATPRHTDALVKLEEVARSVIAAMPSAWTVTSPPAGQPEGQRLTARILESQQERSSMSQPASSNDDHATDLTDQYHALQAERGKLQTVLNDLARRIEARPPGTSVATVTAEQLAQAEAANQQLQAEFEAVKQREEQLAGRLRIAIDAAAVQFNSIHKTLASAVDDFDKLLKDEHPEEIVKQLQGMRESIQTWDKAVSDLEAQWQVQRRALQSDEKTDVLAVQLALQTSAQTFVEDATKAGAALTQSVDAISQGQDQTTKRLVLRNSLVKQLAPITAAQESVLAAARSAILTSNVELTAIVQRLDSLRRQVHQRRAQIAEALRQNQINQVHREHETTLAKARQEQSQLMRRLSEIDADLQQLGEASVRAAADLTAQTHQLGELATRQQQELRDYRQLLNLHEQYVQRISAMPAPTGPMHTPARMLAGRTTGPAFTTALMIGTAPVVLSGVVLLIAGLVAASRRSRNTIEEYARSLKDIAYRDEVKPAAPRSKLKSK